MADTTDIDNTSLTSKSSMGEDRLSQVRSDEVDELLSYVPHWIIRWGITVIFAVLGLLFLASWVIEYPDVISAKISIYTQHPPASIVSRTNGKIVRLLVKDHDQVKPGAILGLIENPANYEDYLRLKIFLDSCRKSYVEKNFWLNLVVDESMNLGELQPEYSDFIRKLNELKTFFKLNYHPKKIQSLKIQNGVLRELQIRLQSQKSIIQKELELSEKNHTTHKSLFEKGMLSEIELTQTENEYLQKKYNLESAESSLINNTVKITDIDMEIMDHDREYRQQDEQLTIALNESYHKLESAVSIWEQRYILISPIEGQVSFFKFWSLNQYVNENEEIMAIVPSSKDMMGKIFLKGHGIGKIKERQRVKIKLDGFPYHEFGIVNGIVEQVSLAAQEGSVSVTVNLPDGLKTSYHKTPDFKQGMTGQAEIITEDLKLIERIFNQFRYLFTDVIKN